jgi:hypothetical protein
MRRAPVRLRANYRGGADLLAVGSHPDGATRYVVARVEALGKVQRIELVAPVGGNTAWRVLDVAVDSQGNMYVLELVGEEQEQHSLRKLSPTGSQLWERRGPVDLSRLAVEQLRGNFDQLLIDGADNVYLPATRHRGRLAQVDPHTGTTSVVADWGNWTGEVLMDSRGRVFFVRYDASEGRRAWVSVDPITNKQTSILGSEEAWEFLASPFGVDDAGRAYGASGNTLANVGTDGQLTWRMRLDNIVVGAPGQLVLSAMAEESGAPFVNATLVESDRITAQIRLDLPAQVVEQNGFWRIAAQREDGGFVVHGGARSDAAGLIINYSPTGGYESVSQAGADVFLTHFDLQRPSQSSVHPDGSIVLGVRGPEGLHLFALGRG